MNIKDIDKLKHFLRTNEKKIKFCLIFLLTVYKVMLFVKRPEEDFKDCL